MMLGHSAIARKSSKFEDSDTRMAKPRTVSELPQQRPSQRLRSAAGSGAPRRALGVRVTAPRSPLHEKKPAGAAGGAGAGGAGPRVAELEAKLERAHGQLMGMRDQLAAAEKARKDARAALVEAKRRLAAKKSDGVAAPKPDGHGEGKVQAAADDGADDGAADGAEGDSEVKSYVNSPADHDGLVIEEVNKTGDEEVESTTTIGVADGDGEKGRSQEVELLRAKLMAKDMEVYELRAKLMVIDTEVEDLKGKVMAKNAELDELNAKLTSNNALVDKLTANLAAKDAEIAALEADNADLTKMAEEAAAAAKAAAARARETEHALRESAAREAALAERLRASERAREALDAEAQRARVQGEQWRKAAEEAADVVLGGGAAGTSSTDKRRLRSASVAGGADESAADKDADDEGPGGKRKAGGAMRALSDLWKKKAQK